MTHKAFKLSLLLPVAALFAASVISGCSSSTTTTPTNTNVTPKAGSTYTYNKHEVDSTSGNPATTPPDSTIIATVISGGTTFEGEANVVTLYDDFDTLRYQIESDNDISIYLKQFGTAGYSFVNPSPWMRLPFGSKKTGVQLFSFDTVISAGTQNVNAHVTGTADYIGSDALTSTSGNVSGGQVKTTITINASLLGSTFTFTATQYYSFDPTIGGYFHKTANTIIPDVKVLGTTVIQGSTSKTEKKLTAYSLIK